MLNPAELRKRYSIKRQDVTGPRFLVIEESTGEPIAAFHDEDDAVLFIRAKVRAIANAMLETIVEKALNNNPEYNEARAMLASLSTLNPDYLN